MKTTLRLVVGSIALVGTLAAASGQPVPALLVLKEGDAVNGVTVTDLGDPYTNSIGQVGFVITLSDTTRGVWAAGNQIFNTSQDANLVGGVESTMGISDALDFLISPTVVGNLDAVYTSAGVLLKASDAAPGFPGRFSSFNSRPRMVANGSTFWVGGTTATLGGATTQRVYYKNVTPNVPGATTPLLAGGQLFGGESLAMTGIEFAHDASDDGSQYINRLTMSGSTATDAFVAVNGTTIVAREGSVADSGELWQGFSFVGINNAGQWVVSGDTDGSLATDGIVATPAGVIFREGQSVGGIVYSGAINAISVNNVGGVTFIMGTGGTNEALVTGPIASFLANADLLLKTGDAIDINNDNVADFIVTDFNASTTIAPGLDTDDSGAIYVNVDISDLGGAALGEAIIAVGELPSGPSCDDIDFNNVGSLFDPCDIDSFLLVFSEGPCTLCGV